MSLINELKQLRRQDIRGIAQLAAEATVGVTQITEAVHRSVWDTLGVTGARAPGRTRGITGLVYKTVYAVTQLAGKSVDTALAILPPVFEKTENTEPAVTRRRTVLAALNGVLGDHLAASNNSLAIPMSMRHGDEALNWPNLPSVPTASGKVLLLIHGLCMSDRKWQAQHLDLNLEVDHGEALASSLDYTPVYLRYNSGRHVSHNGRELSAQLEQLVTHWPTTPEELTVVAHSMGGLLIRSAVHDARRKGLRWPAYLKNIVFLGTPHHGAPLERVGNWVDAIMGSTTYSRPFARLGHLRSAGITDLRYGQVLDDDCCVQERFHFKTDHRQHVPLPEGVACYTIAASMAARRSLLADRLLGDGLVPLRSALGQHDDALRTLGFEKTSQWIAYGMNHLELLSNPRVTRQLLQWLTPNGR